MLRSRSDDKKSQITGFAFAVIVNYFGVEAAELLAATTKLRKLQLVVLLLMRLFMLSAPSSALQMEVEEQLVVGIVRRILVVRVVATEAVGPLLGVGILPGPGRVIARLRVWTGPVLLGVVAVLEVQSTDPFGQGHVDVVALTFTLARNTVGVATLEESFQQFIFCLMGHFS